MHRSKKNATTPTSPPPPSLATASPRIKLLFFIFFLVIALIIIVLIQTHQSLHSLSSLDDSSRSNNNIYNRKPSSLYSVEVMALKKYHKQQKLLHEQQLKQQQQQHSHSPTVQHRIRQDEEEEQEQDLFGNLHIDQEEIENQRTSNCSKVLDSFFRRNNNNNVNHHHQQSTTNLAILHKWLREPLFPDPLLKEQLLTYKIRVLLKLISQINAKLWKPLIMETYEILLGEKSENGAISANGIKEIREKLAKGEVDVTFHHKSKKRYASSSLSPLGLRIQDYQEKCFSEIPECSVWSRSKDIGLSSSLSSLESIPEFTKNKNTILSPTNSHLLNFVDLFMNVKCCTEHKELKIALNATINYNSNIKSKNDQKHIKFSLTAGSLLATVREHGFFIPWDTDVDVLIQAEDEDSARKHIFQNDGDENFEFYTKLIDPPKEVDHGRLLGFVYSTPKHVPPHDEFTSRVEIWVAKENKKMQKKSVVLPLERKCSLQNVEGNLFCPYDVEKVLQAGYGNNWCVPCKTKSSNCKK